MEPLFLGYVSANLIMIKHLIIALVSALFTDHAFKCFEFLLRLNMELDLQSLFRLLCTAVLIG
jgi:hypothetical protein